MKTSIAFLLSTLCIISAFAQSPVQKKTTTVKDSIKTVKPNPVIKLSEVAIESKPPLILLDIDKTVVNVGALISSATSNALEVLEKTPGISIDVNGEIKLNGRAGILVLIDGRSTYLSGPDLSAYLKSLPGGILDKIELMENPPARYDAAGNAIINIRLKKNRTAGFTGNISTGFTQGKFLRNNNALNLNYNSKKINIFLNLGNTYEKSYTEDLYDRRYYTSSDELSSSASILNYQVYKTKGINTTLGLDYAASDKTTYGLILKTNQSKKDGWLNYNSETYNTSGQVDALGTGTTTGGSRNTNPGLNLNFLHKFSKPGQELSAEGNYLNNHNRGNQSLKNSLSSVSDDSNTYSEFLYILPTDVDIYAFKVDYIHPLKGKGKFEAGLKSSIVNNDNLSNYYDVSGSELSLNNGKSNHFKYHENINAAYVNTQKTWKLIGLQLGLRAENVQATGNQLGNEVVQASGFHKNYTQLFPSAFMSFKLDTIGTNTLVISLTRRINRPSYQQLNPFVFFRDKYTYNTGNPLLSPQSQYRYELKWQHKQFLRMGLSYNNFKSIIFQTTEARDNIFINKPENIASGYMLLLSTGVSFSPLSCWSINSDVILSRLGLNGEVNGAKLDVTANIARINMMNQFSFKKGWSAELGGYYASKDLSGQSLTKGMYRTNAGVQKKILKDKGSVRLSFEDIFHSWVYKSTSVDLKQADFMQINSTDTQRIGLAFTYRFGNEIFSRKRKNTDSALDEEKGRL